MREELRFAGEITTVVVSNDGIRWYVSIGVDTGVVAPPKRTGESVGIDLGVRTLATLSDGTVVGNSKVLTLALASLRRVDKAIARSRNTYGHNRQSNRRNRLHRRRRRLHARARRLRHDFQHKATTAIAKRYARIGVETLNVSGMICNRRLSRAIADAGNEQIRLDAPVQVRAVWSGDCQDRPVVRDLPGLLGLRQPEGGACAVDARVSLPCVRACDGP